MVEQISGFTNAMAEKIRIGNGIFEKDVKCFKIFLNYTTLPHSKVCVQRCLNVTTIEFILS